jgi:hydroxymethylpyrimidine/phosphomethylpyrimidine kinase
MTSIDSDPVLLCVGGHDPSGGAGVQADIEAARAAGVHACTVITCLTAQDTRGISRLWPQRAEQVEEQCRLLLADSRVGVVKIGLLGSSRMARVLCDLATEHSDLRLVLDPVLASSSGQSLADAAMLNQMRKHLIPRCTLITPNLPEAQTLSGFSAPDDCARRLLDTGCPWVLLTGTHTPEEEVINRLYGQDGTREEWAWKRLAGEFHGSGCTLASAVAARLVLDAELVAATAGAQEYTWASLEHARRTGRGQLTPNRLFAVGAAARKRKKK